MSVFNDLVLRAAYQDPHNASERDWPMNIRDPTILFDLATKFENGLNGFPKNEARAAQLYKRAGDQGNTSAITCLAILYLSGRGVVKNDTEAARLLRIAADRANLDALLGLAVMYQKGRGVPKNESEAVRLLKIAIDQGDSDAMVRLAKIYERGCSGLPAGRAKEEASRLYGRAAFLGNAEALNRQDETDP
jgi:uncharacterized protein